MKQLGQTSHWIAVFQEPIFELTNGRHAVAEHRPILVAASVARGVLCSPSKDDGSCSFFRARHIEYFSFAAPIGRLVFRSRHLYFWMPGENETGGCQVLFEKPSMSINLFFLIYLY
jgi:hypothetical protein